jgi:hypothetical protein
VCAHLLPRAAASGNPGPLPWVSLGCQSRCRPLAGNACCACPTAEKQETINKTRLRYKLRCAILFRTKSNIGCPQISFGKRTPSVSPSVSPRILSVKSTSIVSQTAQHSAKFTGLCQPEKSVQHLPTSSPNCCRPKTRQLFSGLCSPNQIITKVLFQGLTRASRVHAALSGQRRPVPVR